MAKIYTFSNQGGSAKIGNVYVNALNVAPDTIVAAPTPATINPNLIRDYDFFYVDQTSADTDEIDLPTAAPIGTVIHFYCLDVVEIRTELDTDKINNVASKGYTTTAGDLITCIKVLSDNWVMNKVTILGADTTVVAATA
jgi:hypothetical protein